MSASNRVWHGTELSERFEQLTGVLKLGELFWRHHAFQCMQMPWELQFAELSQVLRELPLSKAEQMAGDDAALLEFLSPYLPFCSEISAACAIGQFDVSVLPDVEPRDIPGRKWQQIRHFAPCIPQNNLSLLEWCAGKSHLGRVVAHERGCPVSALEYNTELIDAGTRLAQREHINIDFHCVDALSAHAASVIDTQQNAVALHACGDLHAQLLRLCAQKQTATITVAPCCYQLMRDESSYLLSQIAKQSGLSIQRSDLRTAVQGSVTISARENHRRQQLQAWRLGFDVLQRDIRGCNEYLPTPSLPVTVLKNGFEYFCRKVAELRGIELPAVVDFAHYEQIGPARLREVTALDLPRIAFRRVLELWLVLDRALYLQEQGYRVEVGLFCARELTPRNIVIRANC